MNARSVIVCLLAAPLLIAAAPEPIRLKPSSKWVIDYAENSCQLIRTFGKGDNKTILLIKSTTPDTATMLASGRPLASSRGEISARFRPGGAQAVGNGTISTAGDAGVLWTHVPWWPDPKALGRFSGEGSEERCAAGPSRSE